MMRVYIYMAFHIVTQSLLLHLIAATASQYIPQHLQYPFNQGNQMPMMQMPHGQQMMHMPNGGTMMQIPNAPPMMPYLPRLPGMPSNAMHHPIAFPMNGGRLPMMVRPHYSKKADKPKKKPRKPKRKRINMESSSSEGSCSKSEAEFRAKNNLRTLKRRRQVLTPVVSYVTKEGYVVYQKKIKKEKAKDWLDMAKDSSGEYQDIMLKKKRQY